jgi:hypothetical protein
MRPICTLAVPPASSLTPRRDWSGKSAKRSARLAAGKSKRFSCQAERRSTTNWVLTFFWELPLDKVALGDLIATENPLVLEKLPPQ